jgi:hypothetical protein
LDVLHTYDASLVSRRHVLWLGNEEVPLWSPGAQLLSSPNWKRSSKLAATQCGRVAAAWLEGPLKSFSSTAHQAETRMLVQPSRELPVMMTGDHWLQKHTKGGIPAKDHGAWDKQP